MYQKTMKFGGSATKPKQSPKQVAIGFDSANLRTAKDIQANPERWGGTGSLMVTWAALVVERLGAQSQNV